MSNYNQPLTFGSTVLAAMIGGCLAHSCVSRDTSMDRKLDRIVEAQPQERYENAIGNGEPNRFYRIAGRNWYVEIDGKPVGDYFTPSYLNKEKNAEPALPDYKE